MARESKEARIKKLEAMNVSDKALESAQSLINGLAPIKVKAIECVAIPFKGGTYGYNGRATVTIDGEEVTASVTFRHPKSEAGDTEAHAAIHKLAVNRAASLKAASSAQSLEERIKAMPKAERLAFLQKLAEGLDEDEDEDEDE